MNINSNNSGAGGAGGSIPLTPLTPPELQGASTTKPLTPLTKSQDTIELMDDSAIKNYYSQHHFKAGEPHLVYPQGGGAPIDMKELMSNPWFNVSFLAVFTSIMSELFKIQSKNHYQEAQLELKARQNILAISTTVSELTKLSYDAQAMQKFVEAISCFGQAAVAGVFLHQNIMNSSTANQHAKTQQENEVKDIKSQKEPYQKKNDELAKQNQELEQKLNPPSVATGPNAPTPLTPEEKTKIQNQIKENNDQIKDNQKFIAERDQAADRAMGKDNFNNKAQTELQVLNARTTFKQTICDSVVKGSCSLVSGTLTQEQGAIEALKTLFEGFMQAMQKYSEAASQAAEKAAGATANIDDFERSTTDKTSRAHSLGNSV